MHHLIKDGALIANDPWQILAPDHSGDLPPESLLPVALWIELGAELSQATAELGVYIQENEDLNGLIDYLPTMAVVAFQFGKIADGRAFSYARQLREQLGYRGEIRAIGDFMPDQVGYLERCGFNAFACRSASEQQTALLIRAALPVNYQADVQERQPLFRRR
jgi:uncharacterized protein (DUF934 family)